jgi:hypothetical protein
MRRSASSGTRSGGQGAVLGPGYARDERVAPMSAPCEYWPKAHDGVCVRKHREALPVPPKGPVAHDTFDDLPTGPKANLPAADFAGRNAPRFRRAHHGLLAKDSPCSDMRRPYGLSGSRRLPCTTGWSIADEPRLRAGRKNALKILLARPRDGGSASEQVSPGRRWVCCRRGLPRGHDLRRSLRHPCGGSSHVGSVFNGRQ